MHCQKVLLLWLVQFADCHRPSVDTSLHILTPLVHVNDVTCTWLGDAARMPNKL